MPTFQYPHGSCRWCVKGAIQQRKKAQGHFIYIYGTGRTQRPRTGWNRGEPQKPPAVWAPPPGTAWPEKGEGGGKERETQERGDKTGAREERGKGRKKERRGRAGRAAQVDVVVVVVEAVVVVVVVVVVVAVVGLWRLWW